MAASTTVTLGLLHPGAMGATVGAAARSRGVRGVWASEGRSPATAVRAEAAALEDVGSLASLLEQSSVVVSVCPPHAALDVAQQVAALAFDGLFVDANAVAPETSRQVGEAVTGGGAEWVDAGIIGPPAVKAGTTRLFLSGARAGDVVELFAGSALEAIDLGPEQGAASALKMTYAAWTKGSAALLLAVRALARAEGVDEALLAEWSRSQPGLDARSERAVRGTAPKAWRFAGEMREIAATLEAAGLPRGFHDAAAETYTRLERFKDDTAFSVDDVLSALRGES